MNGRFVLTIGAALLLTPALSAADFFADLVTSVDAEFAAAATDNHERFLEKLVDAEP